MTTILYVVGVFRGKIARGTVWELQGVFSTEEKAVRACTTPKHFVGAVELDAVLPDGTTPWPGVYYPKGLR